MNLYLTGATGFVGRNLLLEALRIRRYEKIFVPVRDTSRLQKQLTEEGFQTLPPGLIPLKAGDDFEIPREKIDEMIHCAGVLFARDREAYRRVNVQATLRMIADMAPASRILIVSSQSAGGAAPSGQRARVETHADSPLTWYGESKREMEETLREKFPDRTFLFLRPPMILGPRDAATLPLFQMTGGFLRIKPAWHTKFYSWIAVEDLISAFLTALDDSTFWSKAETQKFYVASPDIISDWELISTAAETRGKKGITLPLPQPALRALSAVVDALPGLRSRIPSLTRDRAKEVWQSQMVVDPTAFSNRFHWNAKKSLSETLAETWKWYQHAGDSVSVST